MRTIMVKCVWCGERFDRNRVPCVKPNSTRYGHKSCIPAGEENDYPEVELPKEEPKKSKKKTSKEKSAADDTLIDLERYIMQLFNTEYVPPRIRKQINQYHTEFNYSYNGIKKSLQYFFEVKHNPIDTYGQTIGIVPYVYQQAKQYYYALYMAQLANESVTKQQTEIKVVEYTIKQPIQHKRTIKLFTFEEDDE